MKILQVVPSYPPKIGGVENHVFQLVSHLRARGHSVDLLTSNLPPSTTSYSAYDIRLPVLFNASGKWGEIPICPSIFSKLATMRPDIVHVHTPPRFFAESTAFFFHFLSSNKIPVIVTYHLHNSSLKRLERSVWWLHNRTLQRFVFDVADKIVLCNSQEVNVLSREFGIKPDKIAVIPPGVDCDKFNPQKAKNNLLRQKGIAGDKIILFSGRINPVKGLNFLIEAFQTVSRTFKNSKLVICGAETGNYKHELKMLTNTLGLSSRVVFLDPVSAEDYPSLLASCDIFVLPSMSESWPLSLAEALSMEKPVIATDVGGVKEIVQNNKTGLVIKPADTTALGDALIQLLQNEGLAHRLGTNGRQFALNNFNWALLTSRFEDLYTSRIQNFKR